jgi:tetratricopeptide (TPR) repeat protein
MNQLRLRPILFLMTRRRWGASPLLLSAAFVLMALTLASSVSWAQDEPASETQELRRALAIAEQRAADLERSNELLRRVQKLREDELAWAAEAEALAPPPFALRVESSEIAAGQSDRLQDLANRWERLQEERANLAEAGAEPAGLSGRELLSRANLSLRRAAAGKDSLETAFALYEKASDARPDLYEPFTGMGAALVRAGHPTSATLYLDRAAERVLHTRGSRQGLFADAIALQAEGWRDINPASPRRLELLRMSLWALEPIWADQSLRLSQRWRELGDFEQALAYSTPTLPILKRLEGTEAALSVIQAQREVAFALQGLGRLDEARQLFQAAADAAASLPDASDLLRAEALNDVALVEHLQGNSASAIAMFETVLRLRENSLGPKHLATAAARNNLGAALNAAGQHEQAAEQFRQALDIRREALGSEHPETIAAMTNLAGALSSLPEGVAEAETLWRDALATRFRQLGYSHPEVVALRDFLAQNLIRQGRFPEAEEILRETLAIRREFLGKRHAQTGRALENLARALDTQGESHRDEATELLDEALSIYQEALGADHPQTQAAERYAASR